MQITSNTKLKYQQLDSHKGQKIVAALYLVTHHLSDSDPIKQQVRLRSLALVDTDANNISAIVATVQNLLNVAGMAGIISEKNVAILQSEIKNYLTEYNDQMTIAPFFQTDVAKSLSDKNDPIRDKMSFTSIMSNTRNTSHISREYKSNTKDKRQKEILTFINNRKSVAIKDITVLFPDVSEKTIQRELSTLVELGQVTKRGSKRWSIYMAVAK